MRSREYPLGSDATAARRAQATLRHDALWSQWLEHCESERVLIDRQRWLGTLFRAVHATPLDDDLLRARLRALSPLDYAPLGAPNAFRAHVRRELKCKLSKASAEAMRVALAAAAEGWRGVRLEVAAERAAYAEAGADAAVMRKAVLRRFVRSHGGRDACRTLLPPVREQLRLELAGAAAASSSAVPPASAAVPPAVAARDACRASGRAPQTAPARGKRKRAAEDRSVLDLLSGGGGLASAPRTSQHVRF